MVTNTVRLVVDGAIVSPSMTQTGSVTYVSFQPSPLLTSGKTINWSVIFSDNGTPPTSYTNSFPFFVLPYSPIPTNFLVAPGLVDTTKPGFKIRTAQTDGVGSLPQNSIARAEAALAGTLIDPTTGNPYPNLATPGPNPDGSYDWTNVINFDKLGDTSSNGDFNQPNFPDSLFPGLPGSGGSDDNTALEAITWLDLQSGVYRMVVNSDDNFRVTTGPDPHDKAGLVLGEFDDPAGRGATDSLFIFVVETAGFYPFHLVWENGTVDSNLEWFTQNVFGRQALINNLTNALAVKAYRSGPGYPYITRFNTAPIGFSIDYKDNAGIVINKDSVKVTLDATQVSANVGKTNDVTTISYTTPSPLPANSAHTIVLTYSDTATPPVTRTRSLDFTVGSWVTLPASYAVGGPDMSKSGFTLHVWRIDAQDANGAEITLDPNDTIANAELELAGKITNSVTGQPYPNSAAPNPVDNSFTYVETDVINYDRNAGSFGNFTPDKQMPGIMGTTDLETANAAMEILTYVTLPAGFVRMGVNSDDGFRLSPATGVSDSQNALTLGIFDTGRAAADSIFDIIVQEAGTYPMRLVWDNGNGDCNLEWFSVNNVLAGGRKVLINDATNPSALKAYRAASGGQLPPKITSAQINSSGNIAIQWVNGGLLQSTPSLTPPINWTDLNSSGSFSEPATGTKFYRVKR